MRPHGRPNTTTTTTIRHYHYQYEDDDHFCHCYCCRCNYFVVNAAANSSAIAFSVRTSTGLWNCWHWVALIKRGIVQHCMVSRFITLEVPKHIHRIRKPGHRPTKFAGTSLANHAASHAYPLPLTPVCLQSARWLRHSLFGKTCVSTSEPRSCPGG